MPDYSTYPSSAQLRREADAERATVNEIAAANAARAALIQCMAAIEACEFAFGWPADGYDKSDVLTALADMMPDCDTAMHVRINRRAFEGVV